MQCTLNEVRVVKSRHTDDFDEINGRGTTYYKRCVSTCPICIRAAYANAKWPQVLLGGNLEGLQNIFSRRPYQFLSVILIKTFM